MKVSAPGILCLSAVLMLLFTAGCASMETSASRQSGAAPRITPEEPSQMELQYPHAKILRLPGQVCVFDSPSARILLEKIAAPLRRYYSAPDNYPRIFVVLDSSYSALTTPDGNIYISLGALLQADSEDELAAVIAHEMAHVALHHCKNNSLWLTAKPVLNFLGFHLVSVGEKETTSSPEISFQTFANCGWSRSQEEAADLMAIDAIMSSGFNESGLIIALNKVPPPPENQYSSGVFSVFSGGGHPSPAARGEAVLNYIQKTYPNQHGGPLSNSDLAKWKDEFQRAHDSLVHLSNASRMLRGPYMLIGHPEVIHGKGELQGALAEINLAFPGKDQQKNSQTPPWPSLDALQSEDPEMAAVARMSLTRAVLAETKSRLEAKLTPQVQSEFDSVLKSSDTPEDLLLIYVYGLMKSEDFQRAEAVLEQIQSQFGEQSELFPLQLAAGMQKPGIARNPFKDLAIVTKCGLSLDGGLIGECDSARKIPRSAYNEAWAYTAAHPYWR